MDMPTHPLLADYRVTIALPVQWGDQDLNAHVNNVVFFRWLESVRVEYLARLGLGDWKTTGLGPILASVRCDYKRQLKFPDTILIGARTVRIGRSSMTMDHAFVSQAQQTIVATGESTMVLFNYQLQNSAAIGDDLRGAIEKLEGRGL